MHLINEMAEYETNGTEIEFKEGFMSRLCILGRYMVGQRGQESHKAFEK